MYSGDEVHFNTDQHMNKAENLSKDNEGDENANDISVRNLIDLIPGFSILELGELKFK